MFLWCVSVSDAHIKLPLIYACNVPEEKDVWCNPMFTRKLMEMYNLQTH